MSLRTTLFAATAAALLAAPPGLSAQAQPGPSDDGARFDAMVAMARNASPEEIESTARDIFDQAYRGQQEGNWTFAIRGYSAAQRLPNLRQAMRDQLAFWHGYALFQQAMHEQAPQTVASAEASLPMFEEAQALLANSAGYAATVDVELDQLLQNVATYIDIQQAVIRRGR